MDLWVQVLIVPAQDLPDIEQKWRGKKLLGYFERRGGFTHQAFMAEYFWHSTWQDTYAELNDLHQNNRDLPNVKAHIPTIPYTWEASGYDYSIDDGVRLALLSPFLVKSLDLHMHPDSLVFQDANGEVRFFDPSVESEGPSAALIDPSILLPWLWERQLGLVWSVVTTKQYVEHSPEHFAGQLIDCNVISHNGFKLTGNNWTLIEEVGPSLKLLREPNALVLSDQT